MEARRLRTSRAASAGLAAPASSSRRRRLMAASPVLISISSWASRSAPSASRFFAVRVVFDAMPLRYRSRPPAGKGDRRRLRVAGYFGTWPEIQRTAKEIAEGMRRPMRLPPPSTAAISRMEEAITWNRFLERDDAHLMWARAEGAPWKELCYRFGISRPTAHRRWEYALSVIVWRLNGRAGAPSARAEVRDRFRWLRHAAADDGDAQTRP